MNYRSMDNSLAAVHGRVAPGSKLLLLIGGVATGLGLVYSPIFLLIASFCLLAWLVLYNLAFIQASPGRQWLLPLYSVCLVAGGIFFSPQRAGAIEFSFLLANTQQVLTNCVLNEVQGLVILSGIIFGIIRVSFMLGIAVAGYQVWQNRRQNQDWQEILTIAIVAVLLVLVIGVLEPLVVGPGSC